jgi:hypothetical protein
MNTDPTTGIVKSAQALSLHCGKDLMIAGIGKPFKNRVITLCWEDWMVEKGGLEEEKTNMPSREDVSEWVIKSISSIGPTIIRNSWRHHGFSYFPAEEPEEMEENLDIDGGGGGDNNDNLSDFDDDDDDSLIEESLRDCVDLTVEVLAIGSSR